MGLITLKVDLNSKGQDLAEQDMIDLGKNLQSESEIRIMSTPSLHQSKNGSEIDVLGQILIGIVAGISAGVIPAIANIVYDWFKTIKTEEIEVSVTHTDGRSISVKMRKGSDKSADELVEKLEALLK